MPYQLVGQRVDVRTSAVAVEVFHSGRRVASHLRSLVPGRHSTDPAHMPDSHRRHAQWTPSRIIAWAEQTGPNTAALAKEIMAARTHPEQGYRSCLGIIRLGDRYGSERLEAACARALAARALSYRSVESILSHGLDPQPLGQRPGESTAAITTCADRSTTDERKHPLLTNTTLDGLHTLKLPGMARGLLEQREHPDYDALGFEERLACSSTASSPSGQTAGWTGCSKPPAYASPPASRASTSPAPEDWNEPRSSPWPKRTGSAPTTASSSSPPPVVVNTAFPFIGVCRTVQRRRRLR